MQIVYSARDAAGNVGSATRIVVVVDSQPPVVTLQGSAAISWEVNTPYVVSFIYL